MVQKVRRAPSFPLARRGGNGSERAKEHQEIPKSLGDHCKFAPAAACKPLPRPGARRNCPQTPAIPHGHRAAAQGKPREPVKRDPQARGSRARAIHNAAKVRQRAHSRGGGAQLLRRRRLKPARLLLPALAKKKKPCCDPAVAASAKQPLRRCTKSTPDPPPLCLKGEARRRHGRACRAPTRRRMHQACKRAGT